MLDFLVFLAGCICAGERAKEVLPSSPVRARVVVDGFIIIIINSSIGVQELLPIPPTVIRPGLGACNRCDRCL